MLAWLTVAVLIGLAVGAGAKSGSPWVDGNFHWRASGALLGPDTSGVDPQVSIKDPTVVYAEGKWHLFVTVRMQSSPVRIEYLSFTDWAQAETAPRTILGLHDQYYSAPQVFYFAPQQRWYLVYQMADKQRTPRFGPFFSTTTTISDPQSWSRPAPLVTNAPAEPKWLDFWVICDAERAHLFYTSLDGHMWRRDANLADFPGGWGEQQLALQADLFEASHTYKLRGRDQYLTLVEAQGEGRRYYKAYVADSLEGQWRPLADTQSKPFAGAANVEQAEHWTDSISHGELLRAGVDERLEVDPAHLRFLFQGASDAEYQGRPYGEIPWRLGLLTLAE